MVLFSRTLVNGVIFYPIIILALFNFFSCLKDVYLFVEVGVWSVCRSFNCYMECADIFQCSSK